jgi:hypothetical protein
MANHGINVRLLQAFRRYKGHNVGEVSLPQEKNPARRKAGGVCLHETGV